jgi:type I restriction enzyme S subunit
VFREVDERSPDGTEELLSVSHLTGVTPRSEKTVNMFLAEDYSGAKLCRENDFVFNTMWAWMGALGCSPQTGIVSSSYGVYRLLDSVTVNPWYLDLLLRTSLYIAEYNRRSTGVNSSRLRLYPDKFLDMSILLPPKNTQDRIVAFLDAKTAEIDEAIAKKQRLIELLHEQKAILINRAVTQGLNPSTPLRDSGVPWIGEIPSHWAVKRLAFLAELLQTGPFGSQLHQSDYIENGIPAINPSQMKNGVITPDPKTTVSEKTALQLARHRLKKGDIVFARRGEMGRCGLVIDGQEGWLCGTGSILFRPKLELLNPLFTVITLGCDFVKKNLEYISVGATMDNLNTAILSKVSIPVPPAEEQSDIVERARSIETEISGLVENEFTSIDYLNELKRVIIAEAVTGKIKI